MSKTVLFRADAAPEIGGGHVMRCLTLAGVLAGRGWNVAFAVRPGTVESVPALEKSGHAVHLLDGPPEGEAAALARLPDAPVDALVVDHYERDAAFEAACRPGAGRILVIDDLADRDHDCDLLLDQTAGRGAADYAGRVPGGCHLLLGAEYALVRPEFAARRAEALVRREAASGVARVLIAFGLVDSADGSGLALDAVGRALPDAAVDVVLGPDAPHLRRIREKAAAMDGGVTVHVGIEDMAGLMAAADLGLGAGGTTTWERCVLGLPTLMTVVADNQAGVAAALQRKGAAEVLGKIDGLTPDAVAAALREIAAAPQRLTDMSAAAAALCDGRGADRVADALEV